jgi:hypothetical protein
LLSIPIPGAIIAKISILQPGGATAVSPGSAIVSGPHGGGPSNISLHRQ